MKGCLTWIGFFALGVYVVYLAMEAGISAEVFLTSLVLFSLIALGVISIKK